MSHARDLFLFPALHRLEQCQSDVRRPRLQLLGQFLLAPPEVVLLDPVMTKFHVQISALRF